MRKLAKIDVLSSGKTLGVLYALIGLVGGIFFTLFSLGAAFVGMGGLYSLLFGAGAIIFLPLFYGIFGFIGGILMAFIYNLVAKWTGGIKIDLK